MRRLVIDARFLHSSGIGTYIQQLLPRVLQAFPDQQVVLLGKTHELDAFLGTDHGVQTVDVGAAMYSSREQLDYLFKVPHNDTLLWIPHYNVPLLPLTKMLVTVHDVLHLAYPNMLAGPLRRAYARALFASVSRNAAAVLTVSEFSKREILRLTGIREERIRVTPLGVDSAWFEAPMRPKPRRKPYLLFVGNVKPHKNLRGLLTAFEEIHDRIPHDLVIVGRRAGFTTGDWGVEDAFSHLRGRIEFTGAISDSALKGYVAHADALVLPSFYEGFGLPPLEAMAAKCPVIVSRSASLPEVGGDAVLYCDPHQPSSIAARILDLIHQPELGRKLTERGVKRARAFSWEACAHVTNQAIRALL